MFVTKWLEQVQAKTMRAEGASIIAIARDLGVARSSVSVWVRDVHRPDDKISAALPAAARQAFDITPEPLRSCGRCAEQLPRSSFNRYGGDLQHWCRECFKEYQRTRRDLNRVQVAAATARRRKRAQAQVRVYLTDRECLDCDERDPVVLEFDHVSPGKTGTVSELTYRGADEERLAAELARCDVVCASCHRLRTATRANTFRVAGIDCASWPQKSPSQQRAMLYVAEDLRQQACVDCGEARPACLDYDHLRDKRMNVAMLVHAGLSNATIAAEIAKCVVRCASCHRRRTEWGRRSWRSRWGHPAARSTKYPQRDLNPRFPP